MDNYVEHLVKRRDPGYFAILKVFLIALDLLFFLLFFRFPPVFLLLLLSAAATYFVFLHAHVEYEYLYIGGSLTVDKILNKSRKKILETGAPELLLIAPKRSDAARDALPSGERAVDLSGDGEEERKYLYLYQKEGKKRAVYLDMTEELLREMRMHSPSKLRRG